MDQPIEYGSQAIEQETDADSASNDPDAVLPEEAYDDVPFEPSDLLPESTFDRYLREHRLLNSMLMALLFLLLLFGILWNIIIYAPRAGEPGPDFTDAPANMQQTRPKKPEVRLLQRQKKPSPPTATSTMRPIAISDITIPDVELDVRNLNPQVDVGVNTNLGDIGTGVDLSSLNNAFTSSFMGVQSHANRIAFIIDYSASMRGKDKVMRHELEAAVNKLPPAAEVCLIFFSGPSWLAGENANMIIKNWTGDNRGGFHPKAGFKPTKPKWIPVTPSTKKKLGKAIWNTPLTYGSVWNNSYRWALTLLKPKPDVIYFMTDGAANVKGMELIEKHRGSTKIYTIAYGTPDKAKIPLQEIAAMTGGKFKFVSMEQIRKMEKKIKK